ncbi:uncharacterized protein LOC144388205 [Gasterosteus aculeatus]
MSLLNLVFAALLVSSTARGGVHRNLQGQWVITKDDPQYEDTDFLPDDDSTWPDSTWPDSTWPASTPGDVAPVTPEDYNSLTTLEPHSMTGQEGGLAVWQIVLVVSVLLVSVVGSLSVVYYMCIWRGGRIHYQPQKVDYT